MNLDQYKTELDLTDDQLAEKFGCDRSIVTKMRNRQAFPSLDLALRIERATGGMVTPSDLSRGEVAA
jgi:transcriptional regulator with XRE-family HTH domain